jgi:hypothetical protein
MQQCWGNRQPVPLAFGSFMCVDFKLAIFGLSQLVKRASGSAGGDFQHVRINHGCTHLGMAQQLLNGANVSAGLK